MGEIANFVDLVVTAPPNGAWFVYANYDGYPLALFGDELLARRWADEIGYGYVVFWPFGVEWQEARRG